ncbi:MAG: hypothetical protein U0136_16855 [Bdellovibrionota bacterium]
MYSELAKEQCHQSEDKAPHLTGSKGYTRIIGPSRNSELGSFARERLSSAGLLSIAEQVSSGLPLSRQDAEQLLAAPLPMLAKLCEIQPSAFDLVSAGAFPLQPVIYFPLMQELENSSAEDVARALSEYAQKTCDTYQPKAVPAVTIDRWHGTATREKLFAALRLFRDSAPSFRFFGPTTGELKLMLCPDGSQPIESALDTTVFAELLACGIDTLEGGGDLRIHRAAAEAGMNVVFTHSLTRTRLARFHRDTTDQKPNDTRESYTFLDEIFQLRERLLPTGRFMAWLPWSPILSDMGLPQAEAPLGLEILTSIALARLLLPEIPVVRAPVSLLGPKLAEAALHFGANDLGLAALDTTSAEQLGLLRYRAVLDFLSTSLEERTV